MNNNILTIQNFLPDDVFEQIQAESLQTEWYLKQTTENLTKLQWSLKRDVVNFAPHEKEKSMNDTSPLINVLKSNLLKFKLPGKIVPSAVYFTLLMGNERNLVHKDRYKYFKGSEESYTLLLYLNDTWHQEWHGATLFYSDDFDNYIFGSLPKRNKAVIFKSSIKHSIEPFFQDLSGPRVNLVCQFDLFKPTHST